MPADLGVLICQLRAASPLHIQRHMGEAMQQLFLSRISGVDPALAKTLDPPANNVSLYSVSGLHQPEFRAPLLGDVQAGEAAWIRFVGLNQTVVAAMDMAFVNEQSRPAGVEIDKNFWILESAYWEGQTNYQTLAADHQRQAPPREFQMDFLTPTTFKVKGVDMPLPIPAHVFGGLERRWRELSGMALPRALNPFLDYFVAVEEVHRVNTVHLRLQADHQTGFTGQVTFKIKPTSEQLPKDVRQYEKFTSTGREAYRYQDAYELNELLKSGQQARADLARAVGLLADVAQYVGVGRKTAMGMGFVVVS
ncbi:MAG: hypothetical protein DPW16_22220 [Chloroflexi bacterium]|nr:hypothetical protein [Chloroflexota bacterium]